MLNEQEIKDLRTSTNRKNYFFLRRRVDKGNGKKTLGWIMQSDDLSSDVEKINFNDLYHIKQQMEKIKC